MTKKLGALIMTLCILCAAYPVLGATVYSEYTPGSQTTTLALDKPLVLSGGAEVSGTFLTLPAGGMAEYDLYLSANNVSAEVAYNAQEDTILTVIVDGTDSFTLNLSASATETTVSVALGRGSHTLSLGADAMVALSSVVFTKETDYLAPACNVSVAYTNYEDALRTAVVVASDCVGIKVGGAMRYVDYNDTSLTPLILSGRLYLPADTAARAFSLYYEDYSDLSYVYMSCDTFELYSGSCGHYVIEQGNKRILPEFAIYKDGVAWLPVRALAEMLGLTVGYRDGLAVIDERILVDNIITNDSLMTELKAELNPFKASGKAEGTTYHVSASSGDDDNSGSEAEPFFTISKAAQVAQSGDTVIIHEGIYREEVAPANDGTAANPIIFRAADGEKVIISAFEEKREFELHDSTKGIYKTDIASLGGNDRHFVIWNGEYLREGRHPNEDSAPSDMLTISERYPAYSNDLFPTIGDIRITGSSNVNVDDTFTAYSSSGLLNQEDNYWQGAAFVSMYSLGWGLSYGKVTASTMGQISFEGSSSTGSYGFTRFYSEQMDGDSDGDIDYYITKPTPYDYGYITNHYNTIDMPGEWFADDQAGTLYIKLPVGAEVDSFSVEVKERQRVIDLTDRKYVQFRGIDTMGGGVTMAGSSEMCVLKGGAHKYISQVGITAWNSMGRLRFDTAGKSGKSLEDGEVGFYAAGTNNAFIDNTISFSSGSGLTLAGKYAYVDNNIIEHTGYAGSYMSGICLVQGSGDTPYNVKGGHTVVSNTVIGSGRAAFYVGYSNAAIVGCDIGYNDFRHANICARDTGVIYSYATTAGDDRRYTDIHHNIIAGNATEYHIESTAGQRLLFHDGQSAMFSDYANIFWTEDERFIDKNYGNSKKPSASLFLQTATHTSGTVTSYVGAHAKVGTNTDLNLYKGGKAGLTAGDFPYAKPFHAGSTLEFEGGARFLMNYERTSYESVILAADAAISGNSYINSEGYGVLTDENGALTFSNVGMYDGGTRVDVYYLSDKLRCADVTKLNYALMHLTLTDESGGKADEGFQPIVALSPYSDTVMKASFLFEDSVTQAVDLTLSLIGTIGDFRVVSVMSYADTCITDEGIRYNEFPPSADVLYLGSFDAVSGEPVGFATLGKLSASSIEGNTFCGIKQTGSASLTYEDRVFHNDVNTLTMKVGCDTYNSNAKVEIRIDDPESAPVAVVDIKSYVSSHAQDKFGGQYPDGAWPAHLIDADMSTPIPAGSHDIYVTYVPTSSAGTDSYYIAFYNK